ncbi:hypothetical protein TNCV_3323831 [Trichonephila clavipes]|nr:hypothetical protein TNCV_3323831 [Trichonephila clavipes]
MEYNLRFPTSITCFKAGTVFNVSSKSITDFSLPQKEKEHSYFRKANLWLPLYSAKEPGDSRHPTAAHPTAASRQTLRRRCRQRGVDTRDPSSVTNDIELCKACHCGRSGLNVHRFGSCSAGDRLIRFILLPLSLFNYFDIPSFCLLRRTVAAATLGKKMPSYFLVSGENPMWTEYLCSAFLLP